MFYHHRKKKKKSKKRHCISFPIHLWEHEKYIQGFVVHTDLDKNLSPGIYHLLDHAQVIEPLSSIASDGVQSSQKETIWPQWVVAHNLNLGPLVVAFLTHPKQILLVCLGHEYMWSSWNETSLGKDSDKTECQLMCAHRGRSISQIAHRHTHLSECQVAFLLIHMEPSLRGFSWP